MSRSGLASLDLTSPSTFIDHDPHVFFANVRARNPVYWHESFSGQPGFWVVADYRNVVACYASPEKLSSSRGTVLDVLLRGDDPASGKMLAVTDRPRHRELRALLGHAFSPRVLHTVAHKVDLRAAELVDRALELGTFDFATEVAEQIPMNTICDLMEISMADRPALLQWSKRALTGVDPLDSLEARNEIVFYFMDLAELRRENPGTDVVSTIAAGSVGGEQLSLEEVALNCYSLIIGGDESSRVSAISTVKALSEFPEQWRALRNGETDLDSAVEEALRWASPSLHFARTATCDQLIGEQLVRQGDIVTLWNISAHGDERVFPRPREFNLTRSPNRQISFGHGPHYCLGAFLGRAELRAVLAALSNSVRDIEVTGEPARIRSNFLNGYGDLPVCFRA